MSTGSEKDFLVNITPLSANELKEYLDKLAFIPPPVASFEVKSSSFEATWQSQFILIN